MLKVRNGAYLESNLVANANGILFSIFVCRSTILPQCFSCANLYESTEVYCISHTRSLACVPRPLLKLKSGMTPGLFMPFFEGGISFETFLAVAVACTTPPLFLYSDPTL
jgi:hypothetical protein